MFYAGLYKKSSPPGYFDIVAAGVPCQEYSVAKTVGQRNLKLADRIVKKTLEIIFYLNPNHWWIENPRTGWLKTRPFMRNLPFIDIDHCQFSEWGYQKPTRIWCSESIAHLKNILCDGEHCPNLIKNKGGKLIHRQKLGGNNVQYSTRGKGKMRKLLVDYLMSSITSATTHRSLMHQNI